MLEPSRVPLLVLAHLGLTLGAVGCTKEEPPAASPDRAAAASAASASNGGGSASATASASASAPVVIATPAASAKLAEGECRSDEDCEGHEQCTHLAGPSGPIGRCEHRKGYFKGRPLIVDGLAQLAAADCAGAAPTDPRAAELIAAAAEEHASIGAFARTISELLALGAPSWLLAETQEALGDEIRHTEMTLRRLFETTGIRAQLGPLAAATAPLRTGEDGERALFRDVLRGGAIGETLAAADAEAHAAASAEEADDDAQSFHLAIMDDESRHAALAVRTLGWMLARRPSLADALDQERAAFEASAPPAHRELLAPIFELLSRPAALALPS
jgi:hypothetical protein